MPDDIEHKHKSEKTAAGEAHRGAERPDGKPQPSDGHEPVEPKGESGHVPRWEPGRDPNNKANEPLKGGR